MRAMASQFITATRAKPCEKLHPPACSLPIQSGPTAQEDYSKVQTAHLNCSPQLSGHSAPCRAAWLWFCAPTPILASSELCPEHCRSFGVNFWNMSCPDTSGESSVGMKSPTDLGSQSHQHRDSASFRVGHQRHSLQIARPTATHAAGRKFISTGLFAGGQRKRTWCSIRSWEAEQPHSLAGRWVASSSASNWKSVGASWPCAGWRN